MKILIVDNDLVSQSNITNVLDNTGFETVQTSSVKDAIAYLQSQPIAKLIISDIDLPGRSGFDFLKYLKSNVKLRKIPVMICSSRQDNDSVVRSINLGAEDYIIKPIDKEKLLTKVKTLLSKNDGKVLIVDDQEIVLNVLSKILEREGFQTITAQSAEKALEIMSTSNVKLVISDIVMPEIDGFELLTRIKKQHPRVKVMLITGYEGKFRKEDIIAAGADGYIIKPFKNIDVIQSINSLSCHSLV